MRETKYRYWINGKPYIFNMKEIESAMACSEVMSQKYENRDVSTGKKDKKNIDIFEGDILRFVFTMDGKKILVDEKAVVVFDDYQLWFCALVYQKDGDERWDRDIMGEQQQYIEVIGNINENKDLLK